MAQKKRRQSPRGARWEHYKYESFLVPVGEDKASIASYREIGPRQVVAVVDGRGTKNFRTAVAARRWIEGVVKQHQRRAR